MIEIRLAEAAEDDRDEIEGTIFSDRFLIKRPLLYAVEALHQNQLALRLRDDNNGEQCPIWLVEVEGESDEQRSQPPRPSSSPRKSTTHSSSRTAVA